MKCMLYYTANAVQTSVILHEELRYFNNKSETSDSFIDHDTTSETSMAFTILLLVLSSSGILTTCFLLYGLYRDWKVMLIPWICNIILFIIADFSYVMYSLFAHALTWNPPAAIIVTLDFFLNALHVYSLLCVISQYQELKAGRGRSVDDQIYRQVPNVHYSCQPTATSNLSSRKPVTYYETKPTPTQSPTGTLRPSPSVIPYIVSPNRRGSRKSVKFPDGANLVQHNGSQLLDPWSIEVKSPMLVPKGLETSPLIETAVVTVPVPSNTQTKQSKV